MGIDTNGVAMFLHIALVVGGMMLAAVLHTALVMVRRARTVAELRPWVPVIRRVEPLMPFVALAVLGTGAWLVHLSGGEIEWTHGWILASVVGLVVAEGVGASLAPRSRSLTTAIDDAPEGSIGPEVRRRVLDPMLWHGSHFVTAVFFGIIFVMAAQPSGVASSLILVAAGVIGVLSAVPFVREPHERHARARAGRPPGTGDLAGGHP